MSFANPEYKAVQAILNGSIVKASDKPLDTKSYSSIIRDQIEHLIL